MGFRSLKQAICLVVLVSTSIVTVPSDAEAGPLLDWLFKRRTAAYYPGSGAGGGCCLTRGCLGGGLCGMCNRGQTAYRPQLQNTATQNAAAHAPGQSSGTAQASAATGCCGDAQCQQTVLRYQPEVAYRTVWQPVPVTTYRRTTTANPDYGGLPMTCVRPCTSYTYQSRRVPYTTYKPVYTQIPLTVPGNCPTPTRTTGYAATAAPANSCGCGSNSHASSATPYYSTPSYSSPNYAAPNYTAPSTSPGYVGGSYSNSTSSGATDWRPIPPSRDYGRSTILDDTRSNGNVGGARDAADTIPRLGPPQPTSVRRLPTVREYSGNSGYTSDWVRGEPIESRTYVGDEDRYKVRRDDYYSRGEDYSQQRSSDRHYYGNQDSDRIERRRVAPTPAPTTEPPSIRTERDSSVSNTDSAFRNSSPFSRPATSNSNNLRPIQDIDRRRPRLDINEPKLLNPRDRTAAHSNTTRYASRIVWADEAHSAPRTTRIQQSRSEAEALRREVRSQRWDAMGGRNDGEAKNNRIVIQSDDSQRRRSVRVTSDDHRNGARPTSRQNGASGDGGWSPSNR